MLKKRLMSPSNEIKPASTNIRQDVKETAHEGSVQLVLEFGIGSQGLFRMNWKACKKRVARIVTRNIIIVKEAAYFALK